MTASILAFEPDLLFSSKLESASEKMGIEIRVVSDVTRLLQELQSNAPSFLIANLDALEGKLDSLKSLVGGKSFRSVGYYSHVNARLGEEARSIGIRMVMSRGAFVGKFEELLKQALRQ